jgi:hypothetical protein
MIGPSRAFPSPAWNVAGWPVKTVRMSSGRLSITNRRECGAIRSVNTSP